MSNDPGESSATDSVVTAPRTDRTAPITATNPREIAVVHGRDMEVTSAVFEFLRALDLRPREWEELLSRVSAATPYTGHLIEKLFEDVQAVVVIFTPDDEARLHPDLQCAEDLDYETRFMSQPRPNVLFEAGMAFGLYAHRTILVEVGGLRPISDLVGRHTVRLGTENAIKSFVNRLQAAGCAINTDGTDWLRNSRFTELAALSRRPVARLEVLDQPPRLFPTNIWLNPWVIDSHEDDLRLILVQQRFAVDGRPIANPPDAGPFGFLVMPGQEFNVNFEVSVPDKEFQEGELLYGLRVEYEDENKKCRELEVFWWYDFTEDKFWNNLNKVPYFDSIRDKFW
jgi:hypothetical protein